MPFMFVTAAVSNRDTVVRKLQALNILPMLPTEDEEAMSTLPSRTQFLSKSAKLVTAPRETIANLSSLVWFTFEVVDEPLIISEVILVPAIAISSQPVLYACNPVWLCLTNKLMLVIFCPACGVMTTVAIL